MRSDGKRETHDRDAPSSEKKKKRKKNREERHRHDYDDRDVQSSSYPPPAADGAIPGMGWEDDSRVNDDEQRRRERRRRRIRQEEEAEAEADIQRQPYPAYEVDPGLERVPPSKPANDEDVDDVDDEEFEKFLSANNEENEEGEEGEYEEEDEQDMAFAAYLSNFQGKEKEDCAKMPQDRQQQQQQQRRYDPKPGKSPREEYERQAELRSRRREDRVPGGDGSYSQSERVGEDPRYSASIPPRAQPQIFEYGDDDDVDAKMKPAPEYSQQDEGASQYSSRHGDGGQYVAADDGQNYYGNYPSEARREPRY